MRTTLRIFACAGAMAGFMATVLAMTAAASAQGVSIGDGGVGFSPFKQQEKRPATQEEIDKQRQLDAAYKAATNKIPEQKTNDPWAVVRPTSPAPAAKKKPPQ
jgi:hypothetical protein